ncbi:MAG: hypothetical protein M3N47_08775 [Chloroflexota bacterium]|nr:hypothetical protein [Chloroflexota bacterium]
MDVFWRDPAGALLHKLFDGRGWTGVSRLLSSIAAGPAASSLSSRRGDASSRRADVFWRTSGGTLAHMWLDDGWNGPEDLGGNFEGEPTACSWAAGAIDVFVRRSDNTIWHR